MVNECIKCNIIFKTKQQLERHISKKNKCDMITKFKCSTCLKYFKSLSNLNFHMNNNNCKNFNEEKIIEKINNDEKNNTIKKTLLLDIS